MPIPLVATLIRGVAPAVGRGKLFSGATLEKLVKTGGAEAATKIRSSLLKVIRDEASSLRTGKRTGGVRVDLGDVDSLKSDRVLSQIAKRVGNGEKPQEVVRELLIPKISIETTLEGTVEGKKAWEMIQNAKKYNKMRQDALKNPEKAIAKAAVHAKKRIQGTVKDGKGKATNKRKYLDMVAYKGTWGKDDLESLSYDANPKAGTGRALRSLVGQKSMDPAVMAVNKDTDFRSRISSAIKGGGYPAPMGDLIVSLVADLTPAQLAQFARENGDLKRAMFAVGYQGLGPAEKDKVAKLISKLSEMSGKSQAVTAANLQMVEKYIDEDN